MINKIIRQNIINLEPCPHDTIRLYTSLHFCIYVCIALFSYLLCTNIINLLGMMMLFIFHVAILGCFMWVYIHNVHPVETN